MHHWNLRSLLFAVLMVLIGSPSLYPERLEVMGGATQASWESEYLQRYKKSIQSTFPWATMDSQEQITPSGTHAQLRYLSSSGSWSLYADFFKIDTFRLVNTIYAGKLEPASLQSAENYHAIYNDHGMSLSSGSIGISYFPWAYQAGVGLGYRGFRQKVMGNDMGGNFFDLLGPAPSTNRHSYWNDYREITETKGPSLDIHVNSLIHPRLEWRNTISGFSMKGKYSRSEEGYLVDGFNFLSGSRSSASPIPSTVYFLQSGTPREIEVQRNGGEMKSELVYRLNKTFDMHLGFSYMVSQVTYKNMQQTYNWIINGNSGQLVPLTTIPDYARDYFTYRLASSDYRYRDDVGRIFFGIGIKIGNSEEFRFLDPSDETYESLPHSVDEKTLEKQRQKEEQQSRKDGEAKEPPENQMNRFPEKSPQELRNEILQEKLRLLEERRRLLLEQRRLMEQNERILENTKKLRQEIQQEKSKQIDPAPETNSKDTEEPQQQNNHPVDRSFSPWPRPPEPIR